MSIKPSYYTVLPSRVRYCDKITAEAKLVYAELNAITSSQELIVSIDDLYKHFEKYMDLPSYEVESMFLELKNNNFLSFDLTPDNKRIISIK